MAFEQRNDISGIEIDVTIIQGRDLAGKDKNFLTGKKTSDPYVELHYGHKKYGKTKVIDKTTSPRWNKSFKIMLGQSEAIRLQQGDANFSSLCLRIFDKDKFSDDDFMGEAVVPISLGKPPMTSWYSVGTGSGRLYYKKAKGDVEVKIAVTERKVLDMVRGNSHRLLCGSIRVALNWQVQNYQNVDLDTSCVAIDGYGRILMDETVYFGDLVNSNGSIRHSGDVREGGRDEIISCDLYSVSHRVRALYFIVTAASSGKTLGDVKYSSVTVTDTTTGFAMCQFSPGFAGDNTAMFLMRLAKDNSGGWVMTIIEDMDHTARDFGTLIPEIKGYSRDIVPGIQINPKERIAIMRKGGVIRLNDYAHGLQLHNVVFGLAWDVTDGKNIDLDASAICLDASLGLVDIVYFQQLRSHDGAIIHGGDEREGDEKGDDEKIYINLDLIRSDVTYIGFVINSYSGEELDDIKKASCHLYDKNTRMDLASYKLSKDKSLDKHTALVMACLYRESGGWNLRIVGEAAHGRVAKQLVDELQNFLRHFPAPPPAVVPHPDIIVNAMPQPVPLGDIDIFVPPTNVPHVPVPPSSNDIPTVAAFPIVPK